MRRLIPALLVAALLLGCGSTQEFTDADWHFALDLMVLYAMRMARLVTPVTSLMPVTITTNRNPALRVFSRDFPLGAGARSG